MADRAPDYPGVAPETLEERAARIRKAQARGGVPKVVTVEVTPEELARDRAKSAARLAATAAELTPDEKHLAFMSRVEADARAELGRVAELLRGATSGRRRRLLRAKRDLTRTLGRAVRDQGRLDEAWEIDPDLRPGIALGREAIARPDTEECACPTPETPVVDEAGQWWAVTFPKHRLVKRYASAEHGQVVYHVECLYCGRPNARPDLPPDLAARVAAEAKYSKDDKGSDLEVCPKRKISKDEADRLIAARDVR